MYKSKVVFQFVKYFIVNEMPSDPRITFVDWEFHEGDRRTEHFNREVKLVVESTKARNEHSLKTVNCVPLCIGYHLCSEA